MGDKTKLGEEELKIRKKNYNTRRNEKKSEKTILNTAKSATKKIENRGCIFFGAVI